MTPLSLLTYYIRYKRSTLMQITLIGVAVLDAIPLRANISYVIQLSRVTPVSEVLDPTVGSQIRIDPDQET